MTTGCLRAGDVDVAVLEAPVDMGLERRGTAYGSRAIRGDERILPNVPLGLVNPSTRIRPFDELTVVDYGDAAVDPFSIDNSMESIRALVREIAETGQMRSRALDFGRPPRHDLREIMNAILYVDRTGCQWAYLPHDFPPHQSVYGYFARWAEEGIFAQLNGLLRQLLREKEGRDAEPSACVIDAQSVKTSTSVPAASQGIDASKKIAGRNRSIVTDTLGLLLTVLVTAASVQDSVAGTRLIDRVAADHPGIRKAWVDGGYRQHLVEHAATLGIDMQITARKPGTRGFTPIPKRRAVERTYGWLMLHRRLARDYETLPGRSEAVIHIAMTDLMTRRITSENTTSWRDPKTSTNHPIPG